MTFSQTCFNVHSELKTFIPTIKRSQVYELLSAKLGYYTHKHFCEDAILLIGSGRQSFSDNYSDLLNKRIKDFDFKVNKEQLNQINSLIDNQLEQANIYAPTVNQFSQKLLSSINYRQGFDILDKSPLYQDLNQACFLKNPNLKAIVLHLFLLSRIVPEWDEESRVKQRKDKVIAQAISSFGKKAILPYLVAFHLAENEDAGFIKPFYNKETLREIIADCVSAKNQVKAHAWYNLALQFGYDNILSGKEAYYYTVATDYANGDFYDSDDGEWYYVDGDEGYEPITLPTLDDSLSTQSKHLTDEFYQVYQDVQKVIEYTKNSFPLQGFDNKFIGYYWHNEYYEDDDLYDEYYEDDDWYANDED